MVLVSFIFEYLNIHSIEIQKSSEQIWKSKNWKTFSNKLKPPVSLDQFKSLFKE